MSEPGAKKHESPLRSSARARVRQKAQLTLPEEIRRAMRVSEGDEIEFAIQADGTITVRGYVSVPSDQAWFFTPEGLAGKQEADDEIAAGGGTAHGSAEAMFVYLGTLGAAD
jgi:bifunctional DNA-binding transcriptional regulator/antitoxin component of YhaV-PrlF toxin-antitoxin module